MVSIDIDGKEYELVYTWQALSDVEEAVGMEKLKNISQCTPKEIAQAVAIGLRAKHPEIKIEHLLAMQSPLAKAMASVSKALLFAYIGHDSLEESAEDKKK